MSSPILETRELGFSWPGKDASLFSGVTLAIQEGRITCMLGANGSGKTTLIELLLGWKECSQGSVLTRGVSIRDMSGRDRGRFMALVPQDERMPFSYSVLEYVLLGRAPYLSPTAVPGRKDEVISLESLDKVGMGSFASRSITQLSGGEKRLVLIARALAQEPRVLLMDEPTNHLDPANQALIGRVLQALRADGIAVLISSHDPQLAADAADDVVLLEKDGVPKIGLPSQMIQSQRLSELYGTAIEVIDVGGRTIVLGDFTF